MSLPGVRALVAVVLVACDAGEPPAPAPPAPHAAAKPPALPAGRDLHFLPADSDFVMHVDVGKLRASQLWSTYESRISGVLFPGFAGCEYDPLEHATSIAIGFVLDPDTEVFVVRGIDRGKALHCLETASPDRNPVVGVEGEIATLTKLTGTSYTLGFAEAHTMIMRAAKQVDRDALRALLQVGAPLAADAELAQAEQRLGTGDAVTMLSRPGSAAFARKWNSMGLHIKQFSGTMQLDDRLAMRFVMVLHSADEATQLARMLDAQINQPTVKTMFDVVAGRAQGDTVTWDIALGEPKLASMAGILGSVVSTK